MILRGGGGFGPTQRRTLRPTHPLSDPPNHSQTHRPTVTPTHPLSDPPTHSQTHPPTLRPTHPPTLRPTHPLSNPPTHSQTHPPTLRPTHPLSDPPTHSLSDAPTHSHTHPPTLRPTHPLSDPPTHSHTHPPTLTPTHPLSDAPTQSQPSSGRAHPARHPSRAPPWARGAACEGQMDHCHTPPRYLVAWHRDKNPQDGSCGTDCPQAQPGNGHVFAGKPVGRTIFVVPHKPPNHNEQQPLRTGCITLQQPQHAFHSTNTYTTTIDVPTALQ